MTGENALPKDAKDISGTWWAVLRSWGPGTAAWALIDQILLSVTNFVMLVLVASAFGASVFGSFAVGWMGILFSLSLQMAMVTAPTITHRPKIHRKQHRSYDRAVLEHAILLASSSAFILAPLLGVWVTLVEGRGFSAIELAAFFSAVLASGLHEHVRRQAFVRDTPKRAFALDIGRSVLLIGGLYLCRSLQLSLTLTHVYLFIALASAAPFAYVVSLDIGKTTHRIRKHVARRHLPMSFRLGVMTAVEYAALNLPLLSLGFFGSSAALGQIRALTSISQVMLILPRSLETFLPRQFRKSFLARHFNFTRILTIATIGVGFLIHVTIFTISILHSRYIIERLFGNEFTSYAYLLPVFVSISLLIFIFSVQRSIFIATNRPENALNARLYSLCASVVLSLTIVPYWEQVGTAIALLLVETVVVLAGYKAFRLAMGRNFSRR